MQETRHSADALRFMVDSTSGLIELRITRRFTALVFHIQGCPAEGCGKDCDAELMAGDEATIGWALSDYDDTKIWAVLAEQTLKVDLADIPQPPQEPSAAARELAARARRVAEQMAAEGYFQSTEPSEEDPDERHP